MLSYTFSLFDHLKHSNNIILSNTANNFFYLVTPNLDWTATERPVVTGVGPINATFAALTNGLLSSTWGIANGFAALTSALGGILTIIILILVPVMIAMTLGATLGLGFIGGLIGKFIRNHFVALV